MTHPIRRLFRDERGSALPKITFSVAVMGLGFVVTADVMDYMSRRHGVEIMQVARGIGLANPAESGIDYTITGSIGQRPVILDPCTGRIKPQ